MRKRLGIILFVRQHQAWTSVKCLQTADPLFLAPSMLLAQVYRHWWCINVSEPNRSAPLSRLPDPDIWLRIGPISDFSIGSGAVCATPVSLQPLCFIKSWDKLEFVGRAIFAFCLNTKKYRCISEKCSQLFVSSSPTVPDSNSDWSALITGSQEKTYMVFMYWSQSRVSLMTVSNIHYVDEPSKV